MLSFVRSSDSLWLVAFLGPTGAPKPCTRHAHHAATCPTRPTRPARQARPTRAESSSTRRPTSVRPGTECQQRHVASQACVVPGRVRPHTEDAALPPLPRLLRPRLEIPPGAEGKVTWPNPPHAHRMRMRFCLAPVCGSLVGWAGGARSVCGRLWSVLNGSAVGDQRPVVPRPHKRQGHRHWQCHSGRSTHHRHRPGLFSSMHTCD